jgi:hypothetical protein
LGGGKGGQGGIEGGQVWVRFGERPGDYGDYVGVDKGELQGEHEVLIVESESFTRSWIRVLSLSLVHIQFRCIEANGGGQGANLSGNRCDKL